MSKLGTFSFVHSTFTKSKSLAVMHSNMFLPLIVLSFIGDHRLPSLSASAHFSPVPPTLALPPQLMTTPAVSTGEGSVQSTSTTVEGKLD